MTIPVLPDPPSRADRANFAVRADAWNDAMYNYSVEANLLAQSIDSAAAAVDASLAASLWVSGTSYVIGDRRYSPANSLLYRRKTNGAGTTDPSSDTTNWDPMSIQAPTLVVVSGTTQTGVKSTHYEMTNASASTFTLPASPAVGDWLWVGFTNGRVDNVIARNSSNIMGLAENMTVDWPYAGVILRYISAGFGWRIVK